MCYVRGMSKQNQTPAAPATYEDKRDFIEEAIELGIKMDKLVDKMNKMNVKDSLYWERYKESLMDAWAALRVASIKSVSIMLER